MKPILAGIVCLLAGIGGRAQGEEAWKIRPTTAGIIAVANIDHAIVQYGDDPDVVDLLLARSRYVGDFAALDRAVRLTEPFAGTSADLVRRARTRAAVHRFKDALADLKAAERLGADRQALLAARAAILIATGHASEVVPQLEEQVARRPGFSSSCALATAYAELGRFPEADRQYVAALAGLGTTSPFPYAWVYFARGGMWSEQAMDPVRGKAMYEQAVAYLPQFPGANVHLSEIDVANGDIGPAMARLQRIVVESDDPEAVALLGRVEVLAGDKAHGLARIDEARQRYDVLLMAYPLAFADHAAEFYLGPGHDPGRAWTLARLNLSNRRTYRALALAMRAASASGHEKESCSLMEETKAMFGGSTNKVFLMRAAPRC